MSQAGQEQGDAALFERLAGQGVTVVLNAPSRGILPAKTVLSEKEITIDITLGDGAASATAYGCDLTYDYVKINGDYRT